MAGSQMAAPSHLSFRLQGQGLQSVQMMNINRNSKVDSKVEEIALHLILMLCLNDIFKLGVDIFLKQLFHCHVMLNRHIQPSISGRGYPGGVQDPARRGRLHRPGDRGRGRARAGPEHVPAEDPQRGDGGEQRLPGTLDGAGSPLPRGMCRDSL